MPRNRKTDELRAVPLFSSCTDRELRTIASLCDAIDLRAGTKLTEAGVRTRSFVIIADGLTFDGYLPGDHLCEHELLADVCAEETVIAATPVRLFVFDARAFSTLLTSVPVVAVKLLHAYADAFEAAEEPVGSLAS